MTRFSSILVANRGEIACRIIRTARRLGYRTVAVYSEADAEALHVRMSDEAVCIGPSPAAQSYLAVANILAAAQRTGAEAVHPGYGFLSENASFARACEQAGLTFIGPPAEAIAIMGDKAGAKRRMIESGVPCVPGYSGEDQSERALTKAAGEIGFPLMIKAAAGGGGRGMRFIASKAEFVDGLRAARAEALNAFQSEVMILEQAIVRPRHIEVQVFADSHGNAIHLGERDCSIQRRHQKVIEEAPSPFVTPALREEMGAAAVRAAKEVGYCGAGTVEFLVDVARAFYFIEMNTRLQVEHPVTEMITGLDLVALQIAVAQGEPLGIAQDEVRLAGHAIEARLYAEDSTRDFMPASGRVALWSYVEGADSRVDHGITTGQEVTPFYDPMIAKIIGYGPDRATAQRVLLQALGRVALFGPKSNRGFLLSCLRAQAFADGATTTAFIAETFADGWRERAPDREEGAIAACLEFRQARAEAGAASTGVAAELLGWSNVAPPPWPCAYRLGEDTVVYEVRSRAHDAFEVRCGDTVLDISLEPKTEERARARVGGRARDITYLWAEGIGLYLAAGELSALFVNELRHAPKETDAAASGKVIAPMHGVVREVLVAEGDAVAKGQRLLVIESMKMQHDVHSARDGIVAQVCAVAGEQVSQDQILLNIAEEAA